MRAPSETSSSNPLSNGPATTFFEGETLRLKPLPALRESRENSKENQTTRCPRIGPNEEPTAHSNHTKDSSFEKESYVHKVKPLCWAPTNKAIRAAPREIIPMLKPNKNRVVVRHTEQQNLVQNPIPDPNLDRHQGVPSAA